jgi:hypothetical protein
MPRNRRPAQLVTRGTRQHSGQTDEGSTLILVSTAGFPLCHRERLVLAFWGRTRRYASQISPGEGPKSVREAQEEASTSEQHSGVAKAGPTALGIGETRHGGADRSTHQKYRHEQTIEKASRFDAPGENRALAQNSARAGANPNSNTDAIVTKSPVPNRPIVFSPKIAAQVFGDWLRPDPAVRSLLGQ